MGPARWLKKCNRKIKYRQPNAVFLHYTITFDPGKYSKSMPLKNEEELVRNIKEGNKTALDLVYYGYHKRIFAFAFSYLKREEDAMDVVHDVFLKFWENRPNLSAESKIEPLIFTITRNTVLSIFRKNTSRQKYLSYLGSQSTDDSTTEKMVDYDLLNEKVESLIAQLPAQRRAIYTLSRHSGLSNKEISARLNIAEKTVEDNITKALVYLRKGVKGAMEAKLFLYLFL